MSNINYLLLSLPAYYKDVKWRVGNTNQKKIALETNNPKARPTKGNMLGYIDARYVMDRLDAVCGSSFWETCLRKEGDTYFCDITIRKYDKVRNDWIKVTKCDGAGASSMEGEKGGSSDALKRAAVQFGLGRYLYNLSEYNTWCELDEWGRMKESDNNGNLYRAIVNSSKRAIKDILNQVYDLHSLDEIINHDLFHEAIKGWNDSDKKEIRSYCKQIKEALSNERK